MMHNVKIFAILTVLNLPGAVRDVWASDPHLLLQPGADQHLPAHPEQAWGGE